MKPKKIVIANWKMNPATVGEAKALFTQIKKKVGVLKKTYVVIAPPALFIGITASAKKTKNFFLGAQNVHTQTGGAYTGEVSAPMLKDSGISYVIVGHSERRAMGETDELVSKKVQTVLSSKMIPVLCIGEREHDQNGVYLSTLSNQIKNSLAGVLKLDIGQVVIAYEPLWAIGKTAGEAMDSHKLHQTTLFIRKVLSELYGRLLADSVKIIYGGSVEAENASELIKNGNVSGFLVGHASLSSVSFSEILKSVDNA